MMALPSFLTLAIIIFIALMIFFFPLILKFGVILYYWLSPPKNEGLSKSFKLDDLKPVTSENISKKRKK